MEAAPGAAFRDGPEMLPAPGEEILQAVSLSAWYGRRTRLLGWAETHPLAALREVSFLLSADEALGIVGQTGSGKTTLARCIAGLHASCSGEIRYRGAPLAPRVRARPEQAQREIQLVYQNPRASLNPRQSVLEILGRVVARFEPKERPRLRQRVAELLELVRLPAVSLERYPRELSGGEAQRIALARALAAHPQVLVCDEPTSSLDVSVQASIIELLRDLQASVEHLSLVFISHDLSVVRALCGRVLVLRDGVVVEEGPIDRVFDDPAASYTRELVAAPPRLPEIGRRGG